MDMTLAVSRDDAMSRSLPMLGRVFAISRPSAPHTTAGYGPAPALPAISRSPSMGGTSESAGLPGRAGRDRESSEPTKPIGDRYDYSPRRVRHRQPQPIG